jgi:hypothetical protein
LKEGAELVIGGHRPTCPVAMMPAITEGEKVRFHTLNRATGNRVQSLYVDAETCSSVAIAFPVTLPASLPISYLDLTI